MRRIRTVFILLAVILLASTGFLVKRALENIELEKEIRHQTVAERIFDEMERELNVFLEREEARPFQPARFDRSESDAVKDLRVDPSATTTAPMEPFVVGYFRVDADGSLRGPSPMQSEPPGLYTRRLRIAGPHGRLLPAEAAPSKRLGREPWTRSPRQFP